MVADYLDPRDHSALTLTNRHFAAALQPRLLSRLRALPLLDDNYALLALHWAATSANHPTLKQLLETTIGIFVVDATPRFSGPHRAAPIKTFTTPGPCPPATITWIRLCGPYLRLSLVATHNIRIHRSQRGNTSAEYAIRTHHFALLRLSLTTPKSRLSGRSTIRYAARNGCMRAVEVALEAFRHHSGAAAWTTARNEVLHDSVEIRGAGMFLDYGETVTTRDAAGRTLLHRAVANLLVGGEGVGEVDTPEHPEVVSALLARGAQVDAVDSAGATALHVAAGIGHVKVVKLLLVGGAAVDGRDADGYTALHWALRGRGETQSEVVEMLKFYGADLEVAASALMESQ